MFDSVVMSSPPSKTMPASEISSMNPCTAGVSLSFR